LAVEYSTLIAAVELPLRVTLRDAVPAFSATETVEAAKARVAGVEVTGGGADTVPEAPVVNLTLFAYHTFGPIPT
jgi:hypothetical protein